MCKAELCSTGRVFQFRGTGQVEQHVIQLKASLKLISWLVKDENKVLGGKISDILVSHFHEESSVVVDLNLPVENTADDGISSQNSPKRQKTANDMQIELTVVKAMVVATQDQNDKLMAQVHIKRELYDIEIGYKERNNHLDLTREQEMLRIAAQKNSLDSEAVKITAMKNSQELEHKRALKALDSEPALLSVPVQPQSFSVDPNTFTTVLKVYMKHKPEFSGITSKAAVEKLLKTAGKKAVTAFMEKWGSKPPVTYENGFEVLKYPINAESMIMDSLRSASRVILAGANQQAINMYWH